MGAPLVFNATVHVLVIVPTGYDYDTELLKRQIRLTDAAHPWVTHYTSGSRDQAPSIYWMSSISMKEGPGIDRQYEVKIRPAFMLSRDQTHAYERYGDQLAKALADILPKDVLRVDSRIELNGVFHGGYQPRDL